MTDPNAITHVANDSHAVVHFIKDYWTIIVAILTFAGSILIVLKSKIPLLEKRMDDVFYKIKKMEDREPIGKSTLFDHNNQLKFPTVPMCHGLREECQMHQKEFQNTFCRKLDTISSELKIIVNQADRKRENTRTEITTMNAKLIELMTQMKTILARDRKEETVEMVKLVVQEVMSQKNIN